MHWWRWKKHGDPLSLATPKPDKDKILDRITKDSDTGCWNWTSYVDSNGYGRANLTGLPNLAHRAAYQVLVGPIPRGLTLDHLCRNTRCVNPAHLEPVTAEENVRRAGAAQTHCKRGHEFNAENASVHPISGHRRCLVCHRDEERARNAARRKEAA